MTQMSNSNKKLDLPAMPFYIGDWKKDPAVQMLSREDKMIWLEMIFLMWESKERGFLTVNGKPITTEMLSVALNLDNQNLSKRLTLYEDFGLFSRRESDGAIFSRRMVKIVELANKRKNAGLLGGNPILVKQELSKKQAKGLPNAENESETEYENESEIKKNKKSENFLKFIPEELNNDGFKNTWLEWLQFRKEVKSKLTESTAIKQLKFLNQNKETAVDIINQSIQSGWKGLFEIKKTFSSNGTHKTQRNTLQDFS